MDQCFSSFYPKSLLFYLSFNPSGRSSLSPANGYCRWQGGDPGDRVVDSVYSHRPGDRFRWLSFSKKFSTDETPILSRRDTIHSVSRSVVVGRVEESRPFHFRPSRSFPFSLLVLKEVLFPPLGPCYHSRVYSHPLPDSLGKSSRVSSIRLLFLGRSTPDRMSQRLNSLSCRRYRVWSDWSRGRPTSVECRPVYRRSRSLRRTSLILHRLPSLTQSRLAWLSIDARERLNFNKYRNPTESN